MNPGAFASGFFVVRGIHSLKNHYLEASEIPLSMKYLSTLSLLVLLLMSTSPLIGQHTFSIVAVDTVTGEVGGAGATCLTSAQCGGCGGAVIISNLVPGKGAMNAQATVCIPNFNLSAGIFQMNSGVDAPGILSHVLTNDVCSAGDTSNRQYGIITLDTIGTGATSTAFTGSGALSYANHRVGANYAIQGNILLGPEILDSMEYNFVNSSGDLCNRLMAALQGANVVGADTRCAPDGLSSKSSFIRVAKPSDQAGQFWLDLIVPQTFVGVDPIDSLQTLFDAFKLANGVSSTVETPSFAVYPNPITDQVTLDFAGISLHAPQVDVVNLKGKTVYSTQFKGKHRSLELRLDQPTGIYLIMVTDHKNGNRMTKRVSIH